MGSVEKCCVVLVTVPDREHADAISTALIDDRLAACVSLCNVSSVYSWQGETHRDDEIQLIIKTHLDVFQSLRDRIIQLHKYDVPEIIALPVIDGFDGYLNWISDTVTGEDDPDGG